MTALHTVRVKSGLACRSCARRPLQNICLTCTSDHGLHPMTASFTGGLQLPKQLLQIEMPIVQRSELEICDDLLVRVPAPMQCTLSSGGRCLISELEVHKTT